MAAVGTETIFSSYGLFFPLGLKIPVDRQRNTGLANHPSPLPAYPVKKLPECRLKVYGSPVLFQYATFAASEFQDGLVVMSMGGRRDEFLDGFLAVPLVFAQVVKGAILGINFFSARKDQRETARGRPQKRGKVVTLPGLWYLGGIRRER